MKNNNFLRNMDLGKAVKIYFDEESGIPLELYDVENDRFALIYSSEESIPADNNPNLVKYTLFLDWGEELGMDECSVIYSRVTNSCNFLRC